MLRLQGAGQAAGTACLALSLALALVLVVGCGGEDEPSPAATAGAASPPASPTPTSTVTATVTATAIAPAATPTPAVARERALTVEEYAERCAWENTLSGDLTAFVELLIIEAPPGLRNFHDALIRASSVLWLVPDGFEGSDAPADEDDALVWALLFLLLTRALEQETGALPADVRATLAEAGCLWTDEFGESVAGLTPTPTPAPGDAVSPDIADGPPSWRTLETVLARDELRCGVNHNLPLFGFREADGTLTGFDVEFCKAIAAAVLGDPRKVKYVDASNALTRFDLLAEGEIDVLIRVTTITAARDREMGVDFAQPTFYGGQGFAVRKDSGINSTSDMGDAIICVQTGTTAEQNVADHFTHIGLEYDPQGGLSQDVADAFFNGRCDVLTADTSDLASRIFVRADTDDYKILPQVISKEPLAPAVRDYDSEWKDVVNWVVHGLIAAEELGITQANVDSMAAHPPNTTIARLLGVPYEGGEVRTLGFDGVNAQFIQRAIRAVGNYGEIYAREIGDNIPRACTLNALVINNAGCPDGQGGIMYAFPYR